MSNMELWYKEPASKWVHGLPIGNGRLGAMISGGTANEIIALNEDTLWSGIPKDRQNYKAKGYLKKVRELILSEEYYKAQEIMNTNMLGEWTEAYSPVGNLYFNFKEIDKVSDYKRKLDLTNGIVEVTFTSKGNKYKRTYFASYPDNVIIIKLEGNNKNSLNFDVSVDSQLKYKINIDESLDLNLSGKAPVGTAPNYSDIKDAVIYDDENNTGMNFYEVVRCIYNDGDINEDNNVLRFSNCSKVIFAIAIHTSFNGYDKEPGNNGKNPKNLCQLDLKNLEDNSYEELYQNHYKDYCSLFNRVYLKLGDDNNELLPTNERLENIKRGYDDLSLVSLYFQYGRYLMISSSRPGTEPANLQGIWNSEVRPPWNCNYTVNINTEMNYWSTEVCNLSECHEPLFKMLQDLSIEGQKTAEIQFGCKGWVANHNVDIWRFSTPVGGNIEWAYWPMGGAWMCQHLWEHYDFLRNIEFLKDTAYPIMKGAAIFMLDWLIEDKDGTLITCPSTSPENDFLDKEGRACCASKASTMDISIIRDLFNNCIKACEVLNIDEDFKKKLQISIKKLPPYRINKYGGIQEWFKDFEEKEPGHRHLSHLFSLYPGKDISEEKNKELLEPCKNTLKRRLEQGGGHTGWSCTWIVNLYARLKESELAYKYIKVLLSKLTYPNLFCVHPPFQIDGNFGGTAGIAEMLIQSHTKYIEILPALPKAWPTGEVRGLKARGDYEVDIKWENNQIIDLKIKSNKADSVKVKYRGEIKEIKVSKR